MNDSLLSPESQVELPRKLAFAPGSLRELGRFFVLTDRAVISTRGILKDVSPENFTLLLEQEEQHPFRAQHFAYAGNEQVAYYVSSLDAPKKLSTSEPTKLRQLGERYVTDGKTVFYDGAKLPKQACIDSFEVLSRSYARDARYCYFCNKRIPGAKPAHFRVVCTEPGDIYTYLSADEDTAFYYDWTIPDLNGVTLQPLRDDTGDVVGISDGEHSLSMNDLGQLARATRVHRRIEFATEVTNITIHDSVFVGVEDRLAIFLLMCNRQTIEAFEELTRGRVGEGAIVRAIGLLNERTPSPLAEVSAQSIRVTALGRAVHQQFGAGVEGAASCLDELMR